MEPSNKGSNEYLEQKGSKLSEKKMIGVSEMDEKICRP